MMKNYDNIDLDYRDEINWAKWLIIWDGLLFWLYISWMVTFELDGYKWGQYKYICFILTNLVCFIEY